MNYSNFTRGPKKRLLLTKDGIDNLKKKLDALTTRKITAIKNLRRFDKDDLDESRTFSEIQQLERVEVETAELAELLQHVEPVVKDSFPEKATVGCKVHLKSNGKFCHILSCAR